MRWANNNNTTRRKRGRRWANNNNSLPTTTAVAPILSSTTVILTPMNSFKRITPTLALHPHTGQNTTSSRPITPLQEGTQQRPATPPLVPQPRRRQKGEGIVILRQNVSSGNLRLVVPHDFVIPKMSFSNMLCMWYCSDISKNILPF